MLLSKAETSASGRPLLGTGEVERFIHDGVDLRFSEAVLVQGEPTGSGRTTLEEGTLVFTNYRLLWLDAKAAPAHGRTCAIPLGSVSEAGLHRGNIFALPKLSFKVAADGEGRAVQLGTHRNLVQVKVEAKDHQLLCDQLQLALSGRAWEAAPSAAPPSTPLGEFSPLQAAAAAAQASDADIHRLQNMGFSTERATRAVAATHGSGVEAAVHWLLEEGAGPDRPGASDRPGQGLLLPAPAARAAPLSTSLGLGVQGILKREQLAAARADTVLDQAFADLRGLMSSAGELVALAQRFREALAEKAGREDAPDGSPAWDPQLEADLLAIGIASPVTRQTAGAGYFKHLSRQLADFLGPRVEACGGMMPLTDCYCLFNRARGTELVSPADLLSALELLPEVHAPLRCQRFESGVTVVVATSHSQDKVFRQLLELTGTEQLGSALTASVVAAVLSVPLAVAAEHLSLAESTGVLCRDDGPEGLRFFRNFFLDDCTSF